MTAAITMFRTLGCMLAMDQISLGARRLWPRGNAKHDQQGRKVAHVRDGVVVDFGGLGDAAQGGVLQAALHVLGCLPIPGRLPHLTTTQSSATSALVHSCYDPVLDVFLMFSFDGLNTAIGVSCMGMSKRLHCTGDES